MRAWVQIKNGEFQNQSGEKSVDMFRGEIYNKEYSILLFGKNFD